MPAEPQRASRDRQNRGEEKKNEKEGKRRAEKKNGYFKAEAAVRGMKGRSVNNSAALSQANSCNSSTHWLCCPFSVVYRCLTGSLSAGSGLLILTLTTIRDRREGDEFKPCVLSTNTNWLVVMYINVFTKVETF